MSDIQIGDEIVCTYPYLIEPDSLEPGDDICREPTKAGDYDFRKARGRVIEATADESLWMIYFYACGSRMSLHRSFIARPSSLELLARTAIERTES